MDALPRLVEAVCVGLIASVLAGCGDSVDGARRGAALTEGGIGIGSTGAASLIVGREYALLYIPASNESDRPVTLERVDVVGLADPGVAEVAATELELLNPVANYARGGTIEVEDRPRKWCSQRRTFASVDGYVLDPSEPDPLVVVRVRPLKRGMLRFAGLRIFYRQGRSRYYQDMGLRARLTVRTKPVPLPKGEEGRPCALVTHAEIAPT